MVESGVEPSDEPTALAAYIRGIMQEQGISEAELSRRSGLALSTIYGYLDGRMRGDRPRRETFDKLAKGLGVDVSDLYAMADRADASGERRIIGYYRQLSTDTDRAEAIEMVRRILLRRPNG